MSHFSFEASEIVFTGSVVVTNIDVSAFTYSATKWFRCRNYIRSPGLSAACKVKYYFLFTQQKSQRDVKRETGSFGNVDAIVEFTATWSRLAYDTGDLLNLIIQKVGVLRAVSFRLYVDLCGDTEWQLGLLYSAPQEQKKPLKTFVQ
jgi:hypothetical protein